jgi:hypothetical protein
MAMREISNGRLKPTIVALQIVADLQEHLVDELSPGQQPSTRVFSA